MVIIEYDKSPDIPSEQRLRSLADSVRRAFEEIEQETKQTDKRFADTVEKMGQKVEKDLANTAKEVGRVQTSIEEMLINIFNDERLTAEVTPGPNYSSATASVYRIGNMLRVYFYAKRNSASAVGNITNEVVCTIKVTHNGKIAELYNISAGTGSTGPSASFQTGDITNIDENTLSFTVSLTATTIALTECNSYFPMVAQLDLSKFQEVSK